MSSSALAQPAERKQLPAALRWGALVWLAVWFPAVWHDWALVNFLHLCDLAVILACIGRLGLGPRRFVENLLRSSPYRRHGVYVRLKLRLVDPPPFAVSRRAATVAAVGSAADRLRPPGLALPVGRCARRIHREPFHGSGIEHQLRFPRPLLAPRLGPRTDPRRHKRSVHGFRCLLAHPPRLAPYLRLLTCRNIPATRVLNFPRSNA